MYIYIITNKVMKNISISNYTRRGVVTTVDKMSCEMSDDSSA